MPATHVALAWRWWHPCRLGRGDTLRTRGVWEQLPASRIVDDAYYAKILPTLDRQLGLGGLRLARFLNDVHAPGQCVTC